MQANGKNGNGGSNDHAVLTGRFSRAGSLKDLVVNFITSRLELLKRWLDPRRDLNYELGYPTGYIEPSFYQRLYDVDPLAGRVVEIYSKECFQVSPEIYEDEDPDTVTAWEEALYGVCDALAGENSYSQTSRITRLIEFIRRADIVSGICSYGCVIIGLDDGRDLSQPADLRPYKPKKRKRKGAAEKNAEANAPEELTDEQVANIFCRTGPGGGIDPTCGGNSAGNLPTVVKNTETEYFTTFRVGGVDFRFEARRVRNEDGTPTTEWHTSFGRGTKEGEISTTMANDKNVSPFLVMQSVAQSMDRLIKEKSPGSISFVATLGEESKVRLYDRAGKKMAEEYGYEFSARNRWDFREYLLTKKEATTNAAYYESIPTSTSVPDERPYVRDAEGNLVLPGKNYDPLAKPPPRKYAKGVTRGLQFLHVYPEAYCRVSEWDMDPHSKRFGKPARYTVQFGAYGQGEGSVMPVETKEVHWTRVVHLTDVSHHAPDNPVYAAPRQRPVLPRILDARKVYGPDAESFYRNGVPTWVFESHPELGAVDLDKQSLKDEWEEGNNSMSRLFATEGGSMKPLTTSIPDPTPHVMIHVQAICYKLGIPQRIFMGSERGELASSQDDAAWNDRLRERQNNYLTPMVIEPIIDRLISLGVLPEPEAEDGYKVWWPDLESQSQQEKSTVAGAKTTAIATFFDPAKELFTRMAEIDFWTRVMGFSDVEAKQIIQNAEKEREKRKKEKEEEQKKQMSIQDEQARAGMERDLEFQQKQAEQQAQQAATQGAPGAATSQAQAEAGADAGAGLIDQLSANEQNPKTRARLLANILAWFTAEEDLEELASLISDIPYELATNAFCPTGKGGGIKNDCPPPNSGIGKSEPAASSRTKVSTPQASAAVRALVESLRGRKATADEAAQLLKHLNDMSTGELVKLRQEYKVPGNAYRKKAIENIYNGLLAKMEKEQPGPKPPPPPPPPPKPKKTEPPPPPPPPPPNATLPHPELDPNRAPVTVDGHTYKPPTTIKQLLEVEAAYNAANYGLKQQIADYYGVPASGGRPPYGFELTEAIRAKMYKNLNPDHISDHIKKNNQEAAAARQRLLEIDRRMTQPQAEARQNALLAREKQMVVAEAELLTQMHSLQGSSKAVREKRKRLGEQIEASRNERARITREINDLYGDFAQKKQALGRAAVRESLVKDGNLRMNEKSLEQPAGASSTITRNLQKARDFLDGIVAPGPDGKNLPDCGVSPQQPGFRAHYKISDNKMNVDTYESSSTIVHEYGHHIDTRAPGALKASLDFLEHRVGNEQPISMQQKYNGSYGANETGRKDKFDTVMDEHSAYYTGKSYGTYATEIVSMGIQKMYENPVKFAKNDPEYFDFIHGILSGKTRRKEIPEE